MFVPPQRQCRALLALSCALTVVWFVVNRAVAAVKDQPAYPVPIHLRNAPTVLMKQLGYCEGYSWDTGTDKGYLPPQLQGSAFFEPLR